jgi:hypothetical protein
MRIICVCTGTKFDEWYVDNLKYMIDTYSGLDYDEFVVIRDDEYGGVYNKLLMFDKYRDGKNIYFDLDVLIKGDCNSFVKSEFTLCWAYWRPEYHTRINSSIISWEGDVSHIHDFFAQNPEYYMMKYDKGIDQLLYENIQYKVYGNKTDYCSFQTVTDEQPYSVYLFNQRHQSMLEPGWHQQFQLQHE